MHDTKRRRLAVEDPGVLPLDLLEAVLTQADVETKLACALASPALRRPLMTSCCWPQEVRLDLHDSRQLRWLQQHIEVVERLSICLESSLTGRFNRLLRDRGAPHLTSLSIHMIPEDMEDIRMQVFELRGLRLVDLSLHNRDWTPVLSTHHLPTTLRALTIASVQGSDSQVFFKGRDVRPYLMIGEGDWSFARQLPTSLTRLRLTYMGDDLVGGLETLKHCSNLEELDVDLGLTLNLQKSGGSESDYDDPDPVPVARALANLRLKRVGLHASSGCYSMYIPDSNIAQMHRTFHIGKERPYFTLEEQIDHGCRRVVIKLTLHIDWIRSCPSLSGFSALKELVIGDTVRDFEIALSEPFSLKGLEVVAATLRHLTVSCNREETCVELPQGLALRSLVCMCSGTLLLHCHARALAQTLGDVLLGYTTIAGTGARLVEELGPRLAAAVLELGGVKRLRQSLLFTRAGLVGEWWYGVFEPSKQHWQASCFCCRVRIWAEGSLCPHYLTFLRFGIVSAHDDRDVVVTLSDASWGEGYMLWYPEWHTA